MKTYRHQPQILLFCSVLLNLLFFSNWDIGLCAPPQPSDLPIDEVVAKVNGRSIHADLLNSEVNTYLEAYAKFGMKKARPELINTLRSQALDQLIDNEVLTQAIMAYNVSDIDSKAEQELTHIKSRYKNRQAFDRYLKYRHLNTESLLANLKYNIRKKAYLESEGLAHVDTGDHAIRSFYDRNKKTFKKKERVHVRHILVRVPDHPDKSQKETARLKAEGIIKEIHEGGDFAKLAGEYSDCQQSRNKSGDLGWIERGFMPAEFDKIAFSLDKGKTSAVFATQFGYHILQVLDKDPAGYVPLEKVRDFIKKYLEQQELKKMLTEHINTLKKKAEIKIFLQFGHGNDRKLSLIQ